MRHHNPSTHNTFRRIANRLAELQMRHNIPDVARQILQNEIEAAARHWFLQGGGTAEDFETKFNQK